MSEAFAQMILGSLNENDFEDWLSSYFRAAYKLPRPAQRNGRRGQRQHGVDVYFQSADDEWIGVQAKAYTDTRLTAAAVDAELALAHQFQPALSRYIVCTLNKRDARLQEHVRGLRLHGRPTVEIMAIEDLAEEAARDQAVLEDLIRRIGAPFHDVMRQVLGVPAPAMSPAVADPDPDQDASLKAIDAWIDEGYPDKALVALASYSGPAGTVAWLRVRVRAQFAKQDYEPVLDAAREQLAETVPETVPDPVLMAQGAHAAQLLGRPDLADEWLARAVREATPTTRPLVVGAYVRVHALRGHDDAETLERFARDQLGDPLPVALAVADASFMLGDVERAVAWYRAARDRQAHWPATSHGNALSAEIWLHIEAADRGLPNNQRLNECTRELAGMVASVRTPGLRTPLVMNLGFAYLALGNAAGAAEAWDEVLQTEEATDDLWLRRCMVSAAHGAALPEDAAEARWATTPTGRLALAAACTEQGQWDRAEALIDAARRDLHASRHDLVLVDIEAIALETRGRIDRVTPVHVATMLNHVRSDEPSAPLFVWLVQHHAAAAPEAAGPLREAVLTMAAQLDLDPPRRLAFAESLILARMDDAAAGWVPHVADIALSAAGDVVHLRAAIVLLRLLTRTFDHAGARALIAKLRPWANDQADVALHCARALDEAGDRLAAYTLLTEVIQAGVHDLSVLLAWARFAVVVNRRRQAHRVLRALTVEPQSPSDHAQLLRVRGLLGVHGDEGLFFSAATQVTADTASAVFGASLGVPAARPVAVAFGRVVHVRIERDLEMRLDEPVLLVATPGVTADGARVFPATDYPWVTELIGAEIGERRVLTGQPFAGHTATVVDVFDTARWSFIRAAELLRLLPQARTGVEAFSSGAEGLRAHMQSEMTRVAHARNDVATRATAGAFAAAIAASSLHVSPRALLRKEGAWAPSGHPGTPETLATDDESLKACRRVVLDPLTVLLAVDLGAEDLIRSMPQRAVMTPQAATLLFDWWYTRERHQRGTVGRIVGTTEGRAVPVGVTARQRLEVASYWRRVRHLVDDHIDVVEPSRLADVRLLGASDIFGPGILSGIALAMQRGWLYLTEEQMVRAVSVAAGARTASLHRLAVHATDYGWWPKARGIQMLVTMIKRGWSWISFPQAWLDDVLRMPEHRRREHLPVMLGRLRKSDARTAVQVVVRLLVNCDRRIYPDISARRLREMAIGALPDAFDALLREEIAQMFAAAYPAQMHRDSRRALRAWAKQASASV